jgi:hypothetical protein
MPVDGRCFVSELIGDNDSNLFPDSGFQDWRWPFSINSDYRSMESIGSSINPSNVPLIEAAQRQLAEAKGGDEKLEHE